MVYLHRYHATFRVSRMERNTDRLPICTCDPYMFETTPAMPAAPISKAPAGYCIETASIVRIVTGLGPDQSFKLQVPLAAAGRIADWTWDSMYQGPDA